MFGQIEIVQFKSVIHELEKEEKDDLTNSYYLYITIRHFLEKVQKLKEYEAEREQALTWGGVMESSYVK